MNKLEIIKGMVVIVSFSNNVLREHMQRLVIIQMNTMIILV